MSLAGPPAGKSTASDKTPQQSTQRTHHRQVSVYCDMLCVLIQSVATVQCESVMLCLHRHSLSIKELWTCKLLNVFYMLRSFNNVKLILIFGSRGNICDPAFSNTMKLCVHALKNRAADATVSHTWSHLVINVLFPVLQISIQTDAVKAHLPPPGPKLLKNKALLCKPLVQNKGVSCKTQTADVEAQTGKCNTQTRMVTTPLRSSVNLQRTWQTDA